MKRQLKSLTFLQSSPDWEKVAVSGYTAYKNKSGVYILISNEGFEVRTSKTLPKGNVSPLHCFTPWSEDQELYEALINDAL